jgi:glycosyltransferase involved in cell wall biosynthesis
VQLPARPRLLFLTSVPYTYGNHPWLIEIEDATSLFFPFMENGFTADLRLEKSPYLAILKTLLESENCRGIITHIRSTAEALPRMFQSEIIARKVTHAPMGIALPAVWQTHDDDELIHLLFTNSWHQNPGSLMLRGGLEVLEAFEILQERYPQVRLTLRTALPKLDARYRRILEKCWVRIIDRFLPIDDMEDLMRSSHIYVLPAARIHIVSVLEAMAYGQVVVASDGWGFDEYLEHGRNSVIVPGRHGKVSWTDSHTGMLREDYEPMYSADPAIVEGLVAALSTLVEDRTLRRRLGTQARQDIATRFNVKNWNKGLKHALDQALAMK